MHLFNRLFVIQFDSSEGLKTVLVSPSDAQRNEEPPFFKRLDGGFGPVQALGSRLVAPEKASVADCPSSIALTPE